MLAFHLRVEPGGRDWRVLAGPAHGRRVGNTVPAPTGAEVALPALLLPDDDLAVTRAELAAGQALGAVFAGAAAVELGAALARASDRGEPLLLVVETPDAALAALPWELLADPDGVPLEATGRAVIVRRGAGVAWREIQGAPASFVWCAEPEAPVVSALLREIEGGGTAEGSGTAEHPGPLVTWVVGHGRRDAGLLAVSDRAGAGAIHDLAPALARSALVVLAVCEAAGGELGDAVGAVLAAGAGACVAPRGRLGEAAATVFLRRLRERLADGDCVARAVADARRAVAALGSPYPEDRWSRIALTLADDRAGDAILSSWRARARTVAQRMGSGFVGVEHLALALVDGPPNPALASIRFALAARVDAIRDRIGRFGGSAGEPTPTPRLLALPSDPWAALAETEALAELAGPKPVVVTGEGTVTAWTAAPGPAEAAGSLEVLLGPEDGRLLAPKPGETIGRDASDGRADHRLYSGPATDPRLSRAHLRWWGDGEVELLGPARLGDNRVEGRIRLRCGDRLALTPSTVLLARR